MTSSSTDNNGTRTTPNDFPPSKSSTSVLVEDSSESRGGIIIRYLLAESPEFRRLDDLRKKGWSNPAGDRYFQRQRRSADAGDTRTAQYFFRLMQKIGKEIQSATGAFRVPNTSHSCHILDMCVAPGGFLATAMRQNPGAKGRGFTLPPENGGHHVLLDEGRSNVKIDYVDITMLAADMEARDLPEDHVDAGNFLSRHLEPDEVFDVVICDGQVLRTHDRAEYRENCEARRLISTQLAIGLSHMKQGGTMVVLLHKIEAWDTAVLMYTFHKFARVQLHKPKSGHAQRSSFYMVASDIKADDPACRTAVEGWRRAWWTCTFGNDEEKQQLLWEQDPPAEDLVAEFGSTLVALGKDVWTVQANALAKAPYITWQ